MKIVTPKVFLVGETRLVHEGRQAYLAHLGVSDWTSDGPTEAEQLVEMMGRLCYRSFEPGLNPNVTKVRKENKAYLNNILKVGHGSVIEHATFNFIFADVSRVFTHELVRHRAGTAMSQESLRFVRLDEISAWMPTVIEESIETMTILTRTIEELERLQRQLADLTQIDQSESFHRKKVLTSAFRRIAPEGLATTIGWSANARAIRHVIEMRTDPGAEEEIRLVFGLVAQCMQERYPHLFGDYEVEQVDGLPWYRTPYDKV